jgi:hypothetical protein
MDAARFFLLRYEPLHGMITDRLFAGLSEAQLRARPQGQNSIVWILWHVGRAEDIGINRFAGDRREVFDEGGWDSRLGVKRRDLGTGMTSEEVSELSARVDVPTLRDYWHAVGQRTLELIRREGSEGWEEVVDPDRLRRVIRVEGDYGPNVDPDRVEGFYGGMTRGWAFAHFALAHSFGHFHEAGSVRGSLGFPGP